MDIVALPFVAPDDGIAAGEPTECFNPNAAVMRAEALARKEGRQIQRQRTELLDLSPLLVRQKLRLVIVKHALDSVASRLIWYERHPLLLLNNEYRRLSCAALIANFYKFFVSRGNKAVKRVHDRFRQSFSDEFTIFTLNRRGKKRSDTDRGVF